MLAPVAFRNSLHLRAHFSRHAAWQCQLKKSKIRIDLHIAEASRLRTRVGLPQILHLFGEGKRTGTACLTPRRTALLPHMHIRQQHCSQSSSRWVRRRSCQTICLHSMFRAAERHLLHAGGFICCLHPFGALRAWLHCHFRHLHSDAHVGLLDGECTAVSHSTSATSTAGSLIAHQTIPIASA